MKILVLVVLISLMGACSTTAPPQVVYVTQEVEIPVYQAPRFDIPERPVLPVNRLTRSNTGNHNVIGKAYVKSLKILNNHVEQLHNLLEGIKKGQDQ